MQFSSKADFDGKLKQDAAENRFTIDGDYIVFDRKSNLNYQVLTHFKLKELLTANPVSKTRLNKNLLFSLDKLREAYGKQITIRATYHSPEYHLTSFGAHDSELYVNGCALSLGCAGNDVDLLAKLAEQSFPENSLGELFTYSWGIHVGYDKSNNKRVDFRADTSFKRKVLDFISNDKMKNILLIGGAAAAAWFFFLRKK